MQKKNRSDVILVAKEIDQYLVDHPNAADSLEGVVTWWLARQRYTKATDVVQQALEHLVREGVVKKIVINGNKTVYAHKEKN